jgi:hypothetical protein
VFSGVRVSSRATASASGFGWVRATAVRRTVAHVDVLPWIGVGVGMVRAGSGEGGRAGASSAPVPGGEVEPETAPDATTTAAAATIAATAAMPTHARALSP